MNQITKHERPGVYSAYEASSLVSGNRQGGVVGLAALSSTGEEGKVLRLTSYEEAAAAFGQGTGMTRLIELLLKNGASAVLACPVRAAGGYPAAFAALNEWEEPCILLCDATDLATQQALKEAVETASVQRKERLAVVAGGAGESVSQLTERAAALNSERVVLVAPEAAGELLPGACLAACVAGAIAGELDPAVPLGGAVLRGLTDVTVSYSDGAVDSLIRGGVTVVERAGGAISVVRGITTRSKTGGAPDQTWRELSTIRIVDDVIPTIRASLRARFTRSKNTQQVQGAIRSQVILELSQKLAREIISGYGEVTVQAMEENPTVCLVDFSFAVTHGLNQIWLRANIRV